MADTSSQSDLPEVAILLAAYNGMQWMEEQVASILAQKAVSVSLFISVDHSDDGSESWCQQLAESDARVTLLPVGQRFGSATQNFFRLLREVNFSSFEYVGFADQDDIWSDQKLSRGVSVLEAGGYAAYSSNVEAFWPNGKRELIKKSQPQCELDYLFEAAGPGCTYLMKRELVLSIQSCLLSHPDQVSRLGFHDWFCYAFARGNGYRWYIDDESFMRYRQHASNVVGVNKGLKPFVVRAKHVWAGSGMGETELLLGLIGSECNDNDLFTVPTSRWAFFKLALTAQRYRRRLRDRVFFACFCLLKSITGSDIR
ncbi:MAG: glycosyltransferase [Oceanospirillaceae bacterium]|nr:glycosyltransferase [Oceanospirillaceae bacterium]